MGRFAELFVVFAVAVAVAVTVATTFQVFKRLTTFTAIVSVITLLPASPSTAVAKETAIA